ncbi:MAG: hypothetical protein ACJ75K_05425 [Actinomycetes bacterium]
MGDLVAGRVTRILPFGAFIRVAGGIDGLLARLWTTSSWCRRTLVQMAHDNL